MTAIDLARSTPREAAWGSFLSGEELSSAAPLRISIELTRNCNLSCAMCPHSRPGYESWEPTRDMSPELFERVLAEILPRVEEAQLQGLGESTLSPHWPQFLDRLSHRDGNARLELITNLTRQDDELWRRTAAAGIVITASVDGATRETYQAVRPGGRFDAVHSNLRLLAAAGADIGMTVTVQRANIDELPRFVELAASCGVRRVDFARVVTGLHAPPLSAMLRYIPAAALEAAQAARRAWRPGLGLDGIAPEHVIERREAARIRGAQLGVRVRMRDSLVDSPPPPPTVALETMGADVGLGEVERVSVHQRCAKPYLYAVVRHDGEIGLCNHLIDDEHWVTMGRMDRQSFDEIWSGEAFRRARIEHSAGRPLNAACGWCYARRIAD